VLGNCPFHILAQQRTELVCGMNLSLFKGSLRASPTRGSPATCASPPCCVRLEPAISE